MKKKPIKKLSLSRETVIQLDALEKNIFGGDSNTGCGSCSCGGTCEDDCTFTIQKLF